jgi:hypothetical protein
MSAGAVRAVAQTAAERRLGKRRARRILNTSAPRPEFGKPVKKSCERLC